MTPTKKYLRQKTCAITQRGIEFTLTFQEWWDIWQQSGKWEERGRKKGQYVMSRYGDTGPYAVGNVFIQTHTDNSKEALVGKIGPNKGKPGTFKGKIHSEETRRKMSEAAKNRKKA